MPDSHLWDMENVLITPHDACQSPYYTPRIIDLFLARLSCYRQGKPLPKLIRST